MKLSSLSGHKPAQHDGVVGKLAGRSLSSNFDLKLLQKGSLVEAECWQ